MYIQAEDCVGFEAIRYIKKYSYFRKGLFVYMKVELDKEVECIHNGKGFKTKELVLSGRVFGALFKFRFFPKEILIMTPTEPYDILAIGYIYYDE